MNKTTRILLLSCSCLGVIASQTPSYALPQHESTVAGSVSLDSSAANTLDIHQNTGKAIVQWHKFDILDGETVNVFQPSSSSILLNRVLDTDPSKILGNLNANGHVWIMNPGGVLFGENAQVNVGGLLATTANIDNDDFMAGNYIFSDAGLAGSSIINKGTIDAGVVGLFAANVSNEGTIRANFGKVVLASTETFTVDFYGDGLLNFTLDELDTGTAQEASYKAANAGTIIADAGHIEMTVAQGNAVVERLIEQSWTGKLQANSVGVDNEGTIILGGGGGDGITTLVDGEISAKGDDAGEAGGKVDILGEQVALLNEAKVDASGYIRGGIIHVGGEYLGGGDTYTARATVIQPGATIKANGGDGEVIVWSDEYTNFQGSIEASGGFVETSSYGILSATGNVSVASADGNHGTWLLDPNNITIQDAGPDTNVSAGPTFTTTDDTAIVTTASIEAVLNGGGNVIVQTSTAGGNSEAGDITVANEIDKTGGGASTLTLQAHNSIIVNANIGSSGALGVDTLTLVLNADSDGDSAGAIAITGATIDTQGGDFTAGGGADPTTTAAFGTATHLNGILLDTVDLDTDGGNIIMRGNGYTVGAGFDKQGINIDTSTIDTTGAGTITLYGTGGNGNARSNGIDVSTGSTITSVNGLIDLDGFGGNGFSGSDSGFVSDGTISSTNGNIDIYGLSGSGDNQDTGVSQAGSLTTVDGDIIIVGETQAHATDQNHGVGIQGGFTSIDVTGNGSISITGTSNATGADNYGVTMEDNFLIRTQGTGDITITGTSGTGDDNYGILYSSFGDIAPTGSGDVNITGTSRGTGGTSHGVAFARHNIDHNGTGSVNITGTAGTGGSDFYFSSSAASTIDVGNAAENLTFNVNTLEINAANAANFTATSAGDIIITPRTASTTIGISGGTGTLNLTDTELARFTPTGSLIIGNSAAGTGAVDIDSYDFSGGAFDFEAHGGSIDVDGITTGANALTLNARTADINITQDVIDFTGATITAATNIVLNADSDNNNDGYISLTNSTLTSTSGDVHLGGGLDDGSNGGTAADGIADNFAWGNATSEDGILLDNTDITTAGTGRITMRGRGDNATASGDGIHLNNDSDLQTANGDIILTGIGGDSGGNGNGIHLEPASTTSLVTTGTGDITLDGTAGTTNNSNGVYLNGTLIDLQGGGNLSITGDASGAGNVSKGVYLVGADLDTTGNGTITINGTGGTGSSLNHGFTMNFASTINSVNGLIDIDGTGGNGTTGSDYGVEVLGTIGSTNGNIDLYGMAGSGNTNNFGVYIANNVTTTDGNITILGETPTQANDSTRGVVLHTGGNIITSGNGAISITGTSNGTGDRAEGISLNSFALIEAGGTGDLTLIGTAGAGTNSVGITFRPGSDGHIEHEGSGDIIITGTSNGTDATSYGIDLSGGTSNEIRANGSGSITITAAANGGGGAEDLFSATNATALTVTDATQDLTFNVDTINIDNNFTATSAGDITIAPRTATTTIGLGAGAGTLSLTDAELARFVPTGSLIIGDSTNGTGAVTIDTVDVSANSFDLEVHGGDITMDGTLITDGEVVLNATGNFDNNAGAGAITTGIGARWLVYSSDSEAAGFDRDSLVEDDVLYSTTFGDPLGSLAATDNAFIFANADPNAPIVIPPTPIVTPPNVDPLPDNYEDFKETLTDTEEEEVEEAIDQFEQIKEQTKKIEDDTFIILPPINIYSPSNTNDGTLLLPDPLPPGPGGPIATGSVCGISGCNSLDGSYAPQVGDFVRAGPLGFIFESDENAIIKMTRNSSLKVKKVFYSPNGKNDQYYEVKDGAVGFFSGHETHKGEIKTILPGIAIKVTGTCYIVDHDASTETTNITLFGGGIELYVKGELLKLKDPIQMISFGADGPGSSGPVVPKPMSMNDVRSAFSARPEIIPSREELLKCGVPEQDV